MNESLKLSNQLCFPIYSLSKEIINMYRPLLMDLDITYPQYLVLMVLWEHKRLNVSEIGALLKLDSGTLTPLLKRLENKDIVVRKRSVDDERVVQIALTEKGIALQEKASCIPSQLMEKIDLSKQEQEFLIQTIHKIFNSINI
ncbi:MarR family winged helix-turn-helix transcriptional regulator [Sphingobacterium rhinopitheci]|uniref:MarR family winged helix-turn-helix transcriptional regulator n=1 Tax=Sphingobacterium rhinopitheci TaxID=2781960 RepID=UPI001F51BBA6|nr:MarR family transcriptional regulator [Sphingobacterium rhinopitheci]MCI0921985.1 MarR family transcriptional regulator [Sphingobacterium rhinopitheci]